jgi:hypothetical protein
MLQYTIKDYRKEMLEYQGRMPKNWIAEYLTNEKPELDEKSKKTLQAALQNTITGNNFIKGIKYDYINVIRKIYGRHNNEDVALLPKEVVTY